VLAVPGDGEELAHGLRSLLQIREGLEEGHHAQRVGVVGLAAGLGGHQHAGLALQQLHREDVRGLWKMEDENY
jgi:hypothetical protein